jgi:hypothetical protein
MAESESTTERHRRISQSAAIFSSGIRRLILPYWD